MAIWHERPTLNTLNERGQGTMVEHLGIEFTHIGEDTLTAVMPVDERTIQPLGLLHGGASTALAETIGSIAANLCVDHRQSYCVGLEINANHLRSVRNGLVTGTAAAVHLGKSTQVWDIRIFDNQQRLVCISRLTMAVLAVAGLR